jgi:squalene-hopene/tetraprenyl-beta-curcumene cyclase
MRTMLRSAACAIAAGALVLTAAPQAAALDEASYRQAREMIEKSITWLRERQDEDTGGWSVPAEGGPNLPAITSLVLTGMLMEPDIDHTDPTVARAVDYVLSFRQDDGGIYDTILANYNTALTVSALSRVNTAEAGAAIEAAIPFLRKLQWSEDAIEHPETGQVSRSHPYYGGVGYGGSSRPDMSNMNLMLQSLHDAGVDCDDEVFQRALVFLQRCQMLDEVNDMPYADGSRQGGFIYATSPNKDNIGVGESKAGTIEETLSDGTVASRLRAYGSITYAGFKSYIYADLDRDDIRVQAALDWITSNYTLEENPGIGTDGYYYFLLTFSRCLDAWGLPELRVATETRRGRVSDFYDLGHVEVQPDESSNETIRVLHEKGERGWPRVGRLRDGRPAEVHMISGRTVELRIYDDRSWAADLIAQMAELQNDDGSFRSVDDRWMEDNPELITAYALIALQHAIN